MVRMLACAILLAVTSGLSGGHWPLQLGAGPAPRVCARPEVSSWALGGDAWCSWWVLAAAVGCCVPCHSWQCWGLGGSLGSRSGSGAVPSRAVVCALCPAGPMCALCPAGTVPGTVCALCPMGSVPCARHNLCPVAVWQHLHHGARCCSWLLSLFHLSPSSPPLLPGPQCLSLSLLPVLSVKSLSWSCALCSRSNSCHSGQWPKTAAAVQCLSQSLGFACLLPFSSPAPGSSQSVSSSNPW